MGDRLDHDISLGNQRDLWIHRPMAVPYRFPRPAVRASSDHISDFDLHRIHVKRRDKTALIPGSTRVGVSL